MAEPLARVDPFTARVAALPAAGGDVVVADRPGLGIAAMLAQGQDRGALADRVRAACGIALPEARTASFAETVSAIPTGPGSWLFVRDGAPDHWAEALADALEGVATVADQSSAYALLRIGGPGARRLLGRGAFIDLHPENFAAGSAAVTLVAHMGMILWQRDDSPTYEVAVFRSYAGSFWHWLETAAAGFGARLARAG